MYNLSGKGLFVFSDPGGAKPILAYITLFNLNNSCIVISDREYVFFSDYLVPVQKYKGELPIDYIKKNRPDFIFTGTSYTSKIELSFIEAANKLNIPTYTFVDHYTRFLDRFEIRSNEFIFPRFILVGDEKLYSIAKQSVFNSEVLVSGNFHHQFLRKWKPSASKYNFFKENEIPTEGKIIVFAPDPLTNVGGAAVYGLDEISVFKELANVFRRFNCDEYTFIIKTHPNQNVELLKAEAALIDDVNILFTPNANTNSLLYYSDLVIGIFSNILVEANIMGVKVVRYLNKLTAIDPFKDLNLGIAINSQDELYDYLSKDLKVKACKK
ncbi:MAG: hypothetical protein J0M08_08240 [Bacteroidetes bacterium]|nr:hypothetical protein [Bacteroidota bacterium]